MPEFSGFILAMVTLQDLQSEDVPVCLSRSVYLQVGKGFSCRGCKAGTVPVNVQIPSLFH